MLPTLIQSRHVHSQSQVPQLQHAHQVKLPSLVNVVHLSLQQVKQQVIETSPVPNIRGQNKSAMTHSMRHKKIYNTAFYSS